MEVNINFRKFLSAINSLLSPPSLLPYRIRFKNSSNEITVECVGFYAIEIVKIIISASICTTGLNTQISLLPKVELSVVCYTTEIHRRTDEEGNWAVKICQFQQNTKKEKDFKIEQSENYSLKLHGIWNICNLYKMTQARYLTRFGDLFKADDPTVSNVRIGFQKLWNGLDGRISEFRG